MGGEAGACPRRALWFVQNFEASTPRQREGSSARGLRLGPHVPCSALFLPLSPKTPQFGWYVFPKTAEEDLARFP